MDKHCPCVSQMCSCRGASINNLKVLAYISGREPMVREPDVALFKIASGSLARRQILADFPQCISEQRILP